MKLTERHDGMVDSTESVKANELEIDTILQEA
jgi:hypothetical protein